VSTQPSFALRSSFSFLLVDGLVVRMILESLNDNDYISPDQTNDLAAIYCINLYSIFRLM
jgi:hypothetical protein